MKRLLVFRPNRLLALALGGLVLAVPLLGLDCEMACARDAARAARTDRAPLIGPCPAHATASPTRPSNAPATPDGCGHHEDSADVKKAVEVPAKGHAVSVAVVLAVSADRVVDQFATSSHSPTAGGAPGPLAALPRVLRL